VNIPAFQSIRENQRYPIRLPRHGKYYACGPRHQLLVTKPKFTDWELMGWRSSGLGLGVQWHPAGAILVVSAHGLGPECIFYHHDRRAGVTAKGPPGPEEPILELVCVQTDGGDVVRVARELGISGEFDAALRQAMRDMEKYDWPVYYHLSWRIGCENEMSPAAHNASCTSRCMARDLIPTAAAWQDDGS
jgi:hypothetical protein